MVFKWRVIRSNCGWFGIKYTRVEITPVSIFGDNKKFCLKYYFLLHISYTVKDHIYKGHNFMFLRIKSCVGIIFLDAGLVSHQIKLNNISLKKGFMYFNPQMHSFKSHLCF